MGKTLWRRPGIVNQRINLDGKSFSDRRDAEGRPVSAAGRLMGPNECRRRSRDEGAGSALSAPAGTTQAGVTLAQAQADTDTIAAQLAKQYPESNTGWNLRLESLRERLIGSSRTTVFVLFGAVGFVLLIACRQRCEPASDPCGGRQKEGGVAHGTRGEWRIRPPTTDREFVAGSMWRRTRSVSQRGASTCW